jgi:ariadne-1
VASSLPPKLIRQTSAGDVFVIPVGSYAILEGEETVLLPLLTALTQEVANLLDISLDQAHGLLQYCAYDKERLIEQWYADCAALLDKAGLGLYDPIDTARQLLGGSIATATASAAAVQPLLTCAICYDDSLLPIETFSQGCGHVFCRACCTRRIVILLQDNGPACLLSATCPAPRCREHLTDSMFRAFLCEEHEALQRYESFLARNFVEKCRSVRYCPAPRCGRVVVGSNISTVYCECSHAFCFNCGLTAHEPSSCSQLAAWNIKCNDEVLYILYYISYSRHYTSGYMICSLRTVRGSWRTPRPATAATRASRRMTAAIT